MLRYEAALGPLTSADPAANRQLSFPGWPPDFEPTTFEVLRGDCDLRITVARADRAVAIILDVGDRNAGDERRLQQFAISLDLRDPPRCLVRGESAWWNMLADDEPDGPFARAATWANERLLPIPGIAYGHEDELRTLFSNTIYRAVRRACTFAIEECDRDARDTSLRFSAEARLYVYGALIADATGRIAQVAEACPGALTMASIRGPSEGVVVSGVISGRSLNDLLADVVNLNRGFNPQSAMLLRRAPAITSRTTLVRVACSHGWDVNDMPNTRHDLVTWFDWQSAVSAATVGLNGDVRAQLASFVSKHAVELEPAAVAQELDPCTFLAEILDWSRSPRGKLPSRTSSPARVIASINAWHRDLWRFDGYDAEQVLPECPKPREAPTGIVVRPICTVGELFNEGRTMRHCVGSQASLAVSGQRYYFHARVRDESLTIALRRKGPRWHLVEVAGVANKRPADLGPVLRWVELLE